MSYPDDHKRDPVTPPGASAGSRPAEVVHPARADRPRGRWSFRIGSVFGIAIYVHATFFVLLVWLAIVYFVYSQDPVVVARGILVVLAVFGLVVLHELGHALAARRFGVGTRDIILLPIGGVSRLERMPDQPAQELIIALAGPAVNVVLAIACAILLALAGQPLVTGGMFLLGGPLLTQLLWINVMLAVFNLLPAFPMDGGRVLRALLSLWLDRTRATAVAARIGQGMAVVFALLGLVFNVLLVLIAVFVWLGARREASMVQLRAALRGVPVRTAMITEFKTLTRETPLSRAAELILGGFQSTFPVVEDGRVVGVLTRDHVIQALAGAGPDGSPDAPIERAMQRRFTAATPDEPLVSVLDRIEHAGDPDAASIVVVDQDRVVGMMTPERIGELVLLLQRVLPRGDGSRHAPTTSASERAA